MGFVEFLYALEQQLGRKGAIYSGNRIKETISDLAPTDRAYSPLHGEPFGAISGHIDAGHCISLAIPTPPCPARKSRNCPVRGSMKSTG